ncbi:MAG: LD-carboxypeptidase [Clostridiales bacterium]|nr:LD-carboxypeptidase [Clostridiales bacterium]
MLKPQKLQKGDTVALVSMSANNIGEQKYAFRFKLIEKRLKELGLNYIFSANALKSREELTNNPKLIFDDIVECFKNKNVKAIIAINGGHNAEQTLKFFLENDEIKNVVLTNPKIVLGYSDTTIQHLLFYKWGLQTYYGQNLVCDICEQEENMLEFSKKHFEMLFSSKSQTIQKSEIWYHERPTYGESQNGIAREWEQNTDYEFIGFNGNVEGELLGGCIERLDLLLTSTDKTISSVFPKLEKWQDKILFLESCEESYPPEKIAEMLKNLEKNGIFNAVKAIIWGRRANNVFSKEMKNIFLEISNKYKMPVVFNANVGHASPRIILPYGARVQLNNTDNKIYILESFAGE